MAFSLTGVCQRHLASHRSSVRFSREYSMRHSARQTLINRGAPIRILFPALSPTMETGKIVAWKPKEGDKIGIGDVLFSVETDKATLDAESTDEGILAKIIKRNGSVNAINDLVGLMVEEGEDWKNVKVPTTTTTTAVPATKSTPASAKPHASVDSYLGFPSVKRLLAAYNLSPNDIKATGPQNRILKGDVLKHISEKKLQPVAASLPPLAAPSPPAPAASAPKKAAATPKPAEASKPAVTTSSTSQFTDIPASTMRQVIAKRLTASKYTIPHSYMVKEFKSDQISKLRKLIMESGAKLSLNDLVIKAVASTLERSPAVNVQWDEATGQIKPQSTVDISVAVAIDGGLITPIITNANQKKVTDIAKEMRELAAAAKEGKLQPNQYQGGTFTISNLGMFGIDEFTAVINPPQACILAIGGTKQKIELDSEGNGRVDDTITVTLSFDSRAVNPDDAAKFLDELSDTVQNLYLKLFL